jgi:hypothetical protein
MMKPLKHTAHSRILFTSEWNRHRIYSSRYTLLYPSNDVLLKCLYANIFKVICTETYAYAMWFTLYNLWVHMMLSYFSRITSLQ